MQYKMASFNKRNVLIFWGIFLLLNILTFTALNYKVSRQETVTSVSQTKTLLKNAEIQITTNIELAEKEAQKALSFAIISKTSNDIIHAWLLLGKINFIKGNINEAFDFYLKAQTLSRENNLIEDNSILPAIAANHKNTKIQNDVLGSVENAAIAPDFSAQPFKYLALPSSLPSSFLSNLWDNPAVAGLEKNVAVKVMYNTLWNDKFFR